MVLRLLTISVLFHLLVSIVVLVFWRFFRSVDLFLEENNRLAYKPLIPKIVMGADWPKTLQSTPRETFSSETCIAMKHMDSI